MTVGDYVRYRCFKAGLLGFRFVPWPVLEFNGGRYDFRPGAGEVLYPLEYLLLIEDGPLAGDWAADLQAVLGVSDAWLGGFIKGFAGKDPYAGGADCHEGHRCGRAVRADLHRVGLGCP